MDPNKHSFLSHKLKLHQLCRICGKRASKYQDRRTPKQCESYESSIKSVFNIIIKHDNEEIHPRAMCQRCYKNVCNYGKLLESDPSSNSPRLASLRAAAETCNATWSMFHDGKSE